MSGTSMIQDLVSEGRATPEQGAMLIEFRREIAEGRERKRRSASPFVNVLITVGVFILVLLGVRKSNAT